MSNNQCSIGGQFVRKPSKFRNWIGSGDFPAEKDRYHLYVSYACPWAHRTIIFRKLKQLENIISLTVVDPFRDERGWHFGEQPDPLYHKEYLSELYAMADAEYDGRITVPTLWDKKKKTIVNNESSEIIRMFNSEFNALTGSTLDLYPKKLQADIDEINTMVYDTINNGVYKVGFAKSQTVYEYEVKELFKSLDLLEERLSKQRYLVGNTMTEADWRLFTTLIRFDPVYAFHFKCNLKLLAQYENLSNYLRDLYQVPGVSDTVDLDHIKIHYYTSHDHINPNKIIPLGPVVDYSLPHNRGRF